MKILHISTYDYKGEGLAALRIHKALISYGIESMMLVADKRSDCNSVFAVCKDKKEHNYIEYTNPIIKIFYIIIRTLGIGLSNDEKIRIRIHHIQKKHPVLFSLPISSYRLDKHPLVNQADIIHLHSIRDFVDFKTFFNHINKPIVWTFHDLNPLYGGFHITSDKLLNYKYYKKYENKMYNIKRKCLEKLNNLDIVSVSSSMLDAISSNEIYSNKTIHQVHNCVDGSQFIMMDKDMAKKKLGIDNTKKVILFLCEQLNIKAKGFDVLIDALKLLNHSNFCLLCVGNGTIPEMSGIQTKQFPPSFDSKQLSLYYSAADIYVQPSFQESFGQTVIESMCCGTPVVMTPVGIASEIINDDNGIVCNDFSPYSLHKAIKIALNRNYNYEKIREIVIQDYSPLKTANEYFKIYMELMMCFR